MKFKLCWRKEND